MQAIITAIIGLIGSAAGSLGGVIISSKLTQYRLQQLEKKVEQLGVIAERTYKLEDRNALCEEKFKVINHRLSDLERKTERSA